MPTDRSSASLPRAMRLSQHADLEGLLHRAIATTSDDSGSLLVALRDLDPTPAEVAKELELEAVSAPKHELMLAWIPQYAPVTYDFWCNARSILGGHGTSRDGRVYVPISPELLRDGKNTLTFTLRVLASGWRYQVWIRNGDRVVRVDAGADSDGSNTADDRVIKQVQFDVGGDA